MSKTVRVNAGHTGVRLPDGNTYDGQVDVVLTDEEFGLIPTSAFHNEVLTDITGDSPGSPPSDVPAPLYNTSGDSEGALVAYMGPYTGGPLGQVPSPPEGVGEWGYALVKASEGLSGEMIWSVPTTAEDLALFEAENGPVSSLWYVRYSWNENYSGSDPSPEVLPPYPTWPPQPITKMSDPAASAEGGTGNGLVWQPGNSDGAWDQGLVAYVGAAGDQHTMQFLADGILKIDNEALARQGALTYAVWQEGQGYSGYAVVEHNGDLWVSQGYSPEDLQEPSDSSVYWLRLTGGGGGSAPERKTSYLWLVSPLIDTATGIVDFATAGGQVLDWGNYNGLPAGDWVWDGDESTFTCTRDGMYVVTFPMNCYLQSLTGATANQSIWVSAEYETGGGTPNADSQLSGVRTEYFDNGSNDMRIVNGQITRWYSAGQALRLKVYANPGIVDANSTLTGIISIDRVS